MKFFYPLLIAVAFAFQNAGAQSCDSIVVQHILIQAGSFSWVNNKLFVDTFSDGNLKSHHEQDWDYFSNPNVWDHPWYSETYGYDSLSRKTSYQESYIWHGTYYSENTKEIYTYDSLSRILTKEIFTSPDGSTWVYRSYQARTEHEYNSIGKDSVIMIYAFDGMLQPDQRVTYSYNSAGNDSLDYSLVWNGMSFDSSLKRVLTYDANDSLIRADVFNNDAGQWEPNALDLIYYVPSGANIKVIDTSFYASGNYFLWSYISQKTYSPDGDLLVSDNTNSMDGYGYLSTYSYACNHQVSGFSGSSHGGSQQWYSSTNGHYTFDPFCRYATEWWHAEDNGTYNDNYQKYYHYADCDSMVLIPPSQLRLCQYDSIELDMELFGGTPPYHYQWIPSTGLSSDTVENPKASPPVGQTYTLIVTDSNGTTITSSVDVTVDSVFTPSISIGAVDTVSSCNTVVLVADPGNYDRTWWYYEGALIASIYSSNSQVTVNRNGTYVLRVDQGYGTCFGYDTIVINFLPHSGPVAEIQKGCNQLFAVSSTALQYQWKRENNNIGSNNDTLDVTLEGNYKVYVTDSNGCTNFSPTLYYRIYDLYVSNPNSTCHDSCNAQIHASVYYGTPPYTYLWSSGETTEDLTTACYGAHTLTVTDSMGCVLTETVSVGWYVFPTATFSVSAVHDSSDCSGVAFFTLSTNSYGTYNYVWDNGFTGLIDSTLCAGPHTVTFLNGGFCTKTFSFNVPVDPNVPPCSGNFIVMNSQAPCDAECFGSIEVSNQTGTAPYAYAWTHPSYLASYRGTTPSNLCPDTYTCIMIDAAGCIDTMSATLGVPPPITATFEVLSINQNDPCSTLVEVNFQNLGQFNYFWWCNGDPDTLNLLCPGTCQITIPVTGSCTTYFSFDVPDSIVACTVLSDEQPISSYSACDGQIILQPYGTPPFTIQWLTGETSDTLTGLCDGTYYYTVTDSVGCVTTDSLTLIEPPPVCTVTTSGFDPLCSGDCNGTLTAAPALGHPPFTYLWSTGSTMTTITDLCAGTYSITMTDSVGCVTTTQVTLPDPVPLTLLVQSIGTSCTGCNDGQLSSTALGGTPPFTYLVSPGGLTCQYCNNMGPGIYTVCVTDMNGCTACDTDTIMEDPNGLAEFISTSSWSVAVYPNPALNHVTLSIRNSLKQEKFVAELFDETGRKIIAREVLVTEYFDLEYIASGIYELKLTCSDGSFCVGKLIRN